MLNQSALVVSKEARIAMLAMQYMNRPEFSNLNPAQYAFKYETIYEQMLAALPTPKN